MTKPTIIYLVRHGESELNAAGLLSGHVDPLLTEKGREQVQTTRQIFINQNIKFDEVYASPLKRAIQTAEILTGQPVPKNHQIEGLKERALGELDGKPESSIASFREKHASMSHEDAWVYSYVPGMESDHDVSLRSINTLEQIAKKNPGKTLLIVGHGGAIRTTIMRLNNLTSDDLPPYSFKNAGYIELSYDTGSGFKVIQIQGAKV